MLQDIDRIKLHNFLKLILVKLIFNEVWEKVILAIYNVIIFETNT